MRLLLHWLILSAAVFAAAFFVPGIQVASVITAVIVAAVLGFINTIIKPVIKILTLPINIITLGLFSLVLNGFFLWLISRFVAGFSIATFMSAFWGAIIVSIVNWFGNRFLKKED